MTANPSGAQVIINNFGEEPFVVQDFIEEYGSVEAVANVLYGGKESIAQEAHRIVHGAREENYGHPAVNFAHTADLLNAFYGKGPLMEALDDGDDDYECLPFEAADVGIIMILVKLSREYNAPKRDNLVDVAGYAATVARVYGYDA